jgi:hypothetical protein
MRQIFIAAALAASALSTSAHAALFTFTISGDYDAFFQIESSPTPDFVADGVLFAVTNVAGFPNATSGFADVSFFRGPFAGLLVSEGFDYLFDAEGPQLYSGTEAAPTFLTGTYALSGLSTRGDFTLTIAETAAAPVPEPASWALMFSGFAIAGCALRRSRPRVSVRFDAA